MTLDYQYIELILDSNYNKANYSFAINQPMKMDIVKLLNESKKDNMCICGITGFGKTVAVNQAIKIFAENGISILYYNTSSLVNLLNDIYTKKETTKRVKYRSVLFLDNFARFKTEGRCSDLFDILDYRLTFPKQKTIIVSNAGKSGVIGVYGASMWRRIEDFCEIKELKEKLF